MDAETATRIVLSFLRAVEARDLDLARGYTAPGFRMVFPGDSHYAALEELVAAAKTRYIRAIKRPERLDAAPHEDGTTSVTCFGTLFGEWLDGTPYEGIRYCDWFLLRPDGKILRQEVWNDMALAKR